MQILYHGQPSGPKLGICHNQLCGAALVSKNYRQAEKLAGKNLSPVGEQADSMVKQSFPLT